MRILHVNKFLYRRGGAEAYMLDVAALQEQAGAEVEFFGMRHPDNGPVTYEAFLSRHLDTDPAPVSARGKIDAASRIVWNRSAARGLDAVVERFRPDVVHLHNIYHQLSPSILRPLKRRGVASVMTLHDYKLACPTHQFLDKGKLCEACIGGDFTQAIRRRCKDGSLGASALLAAESAIHRTFGAYDPVPIFICPSRFMESKMAEAGVYPDRMRYLPHFVELAPPGSSVEPGGHVFYAGRLSQEKGPDVLVDAAKLLTESVNVVLAGEGPERRALEASAQGVNPARIEFLGRLTKAAVGEYLRSAAVLVLPSRCYENQPLTVLEAFAAAAPVIGTALGGTPELIDHGVDGLLVPPDDPPALAAAITRMLADPASARRMGEAGRAKVERNFSVDAHLAGLDALYHEAVGRVGAN